MVKGIGVGCGTFVGGATDGSYSAPPQNMIGMMQSLIEFIVYLQAATR